MAHRDFNAERNALEPTTFELGHNADGTPRVFRCRRAVVPEAVMAYETVGADTPLSTTLPIIDAMVKSILEPDCAPLWDAARAEVGETALGISELIDLSSWLVEQVVNRPTEAPASSSAGATAPTTGTSSTDESPSPAAVASIA